MQLYNGSIAIGCTELAKGRIIQVEGCKNSGQGHVNMKKDCAIIIKGHVIILKGHVIIPEGHTILIKEQGILRGSHMEFPNGCTDFGSFFQTMLYIPAALKINLRISIGQHRFLTYFSILFPSEYKAETETDGLTAKGIFFYAGDKH